MSKTDDLFVMGVLGTSSVNIGRTRKRASQAQAKGQTKPQAPPRVSDEMQASFDRLHQWIDDFDRHHDQYRPTIIKHRGKRKGQVTVRIPFPATPPAEGLTLIFTVTLTKDEVRQLAKVPPWVFAHVMPWQLAQAAYKLFPPGPRRKEPRTLHKWEASREAKKIYPHIKWFYVNKQYQPAWFKDLCEAVKRSTHANPTPIDITAWVIERVCPGWEDSKLRAPTNHPKFAEKYLYSRTPRVRDRDWYTVDELSKKIRPLLAP